MAESAPWQPALDFWRDRPVAVTGATGFVGSHVTSQLVQLGADVVILRRDDVPANPISNQWAHKAAAVRGSLEDAALIERLLGEYQVATVFHLAAQSQVGVANRSPVATFESNIRGTWTLLDAVRRSTTVEQVVVASSDKAYGSQPVLPYTEDMPLQGVHPYDVSKACADMIALSYARCFDVPVTITRCGNFFGPGDVNWARLVPGTVRSFLRGERPVLRSDGSMIRDYLDVRDGARAYLQLAEAQAKNSAVTGHAFNLSLEQPLSVLDMVRLLGTACGSELEPDIQASATHEISSQSLSAQKAVTMLGWRPARSLVAAIEDTVEWYRRYLCEARLD